MASEDVVIRAATTAAASTARAHGHHQHGAGGLSIPLIRVPIPNPLGWLPRPRILGGGGGNKGKGSGSSSRSGSGHHHHNTLVASASVATISETVLSGATATLTGPAGAATAVLTPPPGQSLSLGGGSSALASAAPPPPPPPTKVPLKPASDVLCGALARAASQSTIHPLDTLKVRLQARARLGAAPPPPSAASLPAAKPASAVSKIGQLVPPPAASAPGGLKLPASLRDAAMGLASLYRGVFGAASGAGIAIGAYFAFYGAACNVLSVHCTDMAPGAVAFVSGGVAAVGSSFVKVPLAVCIRSVQAGVYPNVMVAARSIVAAAGPRGLFTGFLPTLLEDVPDMAIKFAAYESMRQVHSRVHKGRAATPQEDFAMGAVAGSLAAAATTPLDVIKTNMMCTAASRPSMLSAMQMVAAQGGGARAFFRGVGPRALSNGINSAVFFAFFEALRGSVAAAKKAHAEAQAQRALLMQQHGADASLPRQLLPPPGGAVMMGAPAVASLAAGGGALVLRRSTSMAAAQRALASGSLAGAAASTGRVQQLMGADAGEGRAQHSEVEPEGCEGEVLLVAHAKPLDVSPASASAASSSGPMA